MDLNKENLRTIAAKMDKKKDIFLKALPEACSELVKSAIIEDLSKLMQEKTTQTNIYKPQQSNTRGK